MHPHNNTPSLSTCHFLEEFFSLITDLRITHPQIEFATPAYSQRQSDAPKLRNVFIKFCGILAFGHKSSVGDSHIDARPRTLPCAASTRMNVPITHDITSGSQRMYMHECCIANVTVDRTPALQPEVRLMHPQSTGDQLPYQLQPKEAAAEATGGGVTEKPKFGRSDFMLLTWTLFGIRQGFLVRPFLFSPF